MQSVLDAMAMSAANAGVRVEVPEWKDELGDPVVIEIRPLTMGQFQLLLRKYPGEKNNQKFAYYSLIQSIFDPATGERMFKDEQAADFIRNISMPVFARLSKLSAEINGSDDDEGKAETDAEADDDAAADDTLDFDAEVGRLAGAVKN